MPRRSSSIGSKLSLEQIDEPRAETSGQVADLFAFDAQTGRQSGGNPSI
jgi:hypothetical protein